MKTLLLTFLFSLSCFLQLILILVIPVALSFFFIEPFSSELMTFMVEDFLNFFKSLTRYAFLYAAAFFLNFAFGIYLDHILSEIDQLQTGKDSNSNKSDNSV